MLRKYTGLTLFAILTACSKSPIPSDDMTQAEAVAAVENAQIPLPVQAQLDPILYPDIERENLYGASCTFVPAGSTEMVALAMEEVGAVKLDGTIIRLAPDVGSGKLPYSIHKKFDGLAQSMTFELKTAGEQLGTETTDYTAHFTLRDSTEQVIYEADGIAECGV